MARFTNEIIRIGTLTAPSAARVKALLPLGFESFQLHCGSSVLALDLKKTALEIKEVLGDSGVIISALGVYGNPLESGPKDLETLKSFELLIDNAKHFGCDIVCGFAGRLRGKTIEESIGRYKEVFGPLAKRAKDNGVRIAFENCEMGGTWKSGDWNIAITPAAWELMFDALPADNIGLQWEPAHQLVKLIDPIPQIRKWVKKVFNLHGKDATVCHDIIREHGIAGPKAFAYHRTPGFGDSNWADIITILRQNDYKGSIDIEGWHDPVYKDDLEMTGQVHALNYLKFCRGGSYVKDPV